MLPSLQDDMEEQRELLTQSRNENRTLTSELQIMKRTIEGLEAEQYALRAQIRHRDNLIHVRSPARLLHILLTRMWSKKSIFTNVGANSRQLNLLRTAPEFFLRCSLLKFKAVRALTCLT